MNQSQRMIQALGEAGDIKVGDSVVVDMNHPAVKKIIDGPGGDEWKKEIERARMRGPLTVKGDRGMKSGMVEVDVVKKKLSVPIAALKKV